ncbi:UDP-N-acetylmuramoyl-tripeptide--D-alanyl-D-alanine ligase [Candidatus Pantoea carbekii]|uniref:UDP-N-acetylmuramoyl-tripeptide--D-alanyl-D-alanine ligase n=1 Tax=Candidatus Pantoea carbekii TaxID=1235990 RepID=U3U688_9GAMM|nr:UDP-N-acetylmuramoyl-tripeptide--D-alanyl-D-alanine ligase [Candidatus Pantoea carbekii]AKC31933.1 UDP-N-acetylmuramoyl-tripeptide--D-alanyl-D- alanine ligase MurF [Candidatus Pantoea carbekii]BAO00450.1 hypothetical protein HHS_04800 [Candidatus Pantoea carbekii]
MIPISLKTLAKISGGKLYGSNLIIKNVTIDSRKVTKGSLFIALIGEYFNGNNFAFDAIVKGAHAILANKFLPVDVSQVVVYDTNFALGQLGSWVRQQAKARVVALTGSSGKTSVKEMTAMILRQCGETVSTVDNLNNHIGVPITLMSLNETHDYAVIEIGANHHGEIAYTTNLVRPESALINNLSEAHLEGFGSLTGVSSAKSEIFSGLLENGTSIINAESNDLTKWKLQLANKKLWRFSLNEMTDAEFRASNITMSTNTTQFMLHTPRGNISIEIPLVGYHNVSNALAASALAMSVDAPLIAIQSAFKMLKPIYGRLYPIYLADNKLLLDDSYNANVSSMLAAIQILSDTTGFCVLVVADMLELGKKAESYHAQIGKIVKNSHIDCVLSIGKLSQIISDISEKGQHFTQKSALIKHLWTLLSEHQKITILIKGSRNTNMNQIVQSLQEKRIC